MPSILYIWKGEYPWDVRAEKFCNSLADNGFDVYMLARWSPGQEKEEQLEKFRIIRVGYNKEGYRSLPLSSNPAWRNAIKKAIERFSPAVLMPREIMLAEVAGDLGSKYSIPVVMDMAENYPAAMLLWKKYRKTFTRRLMVHYLRLPHRTEKKSVAKMDGIITVCIEQNKRLNAAYQFPFENMEVVHNTPESNFFEEVEPPRNNNPGYLGHHGNVTDEKKIDILLKGFAGVSEKFPDLKLLIAGAGESLHDLEKQAIEIDASERIEFTGKYKFSQLKKIISKIDIGVIPYEPNDFNNYTIHNKIFDYFAAGRPVIVSPAEPLRRIVLEFGAGIVMKDHSAESMEKAIQEMMSTDREQLSSNSLKAAREKYNWETDSRKLVEFIKKFI